MKGNDVTPCCPEISHCVITALVFRAWWAVWLVRRLGDCGIVPRLRGSNINDDWAFHGCWLNTGGLGGFRFYPAIAFPCLFFFLCLLYSFASYFFYFLR